MILSQVARRHATHVNSHSGIARVDLKPVPKNVSTSVAHVLNAVDQDSDPPLTLHHLNLKLFKKKTAKRLAHNVLTVTNKDATEVVKIMKVFLSHTRVAQEMRSVHIAAKLVANAKHLDQP
jgi:hypothetical protein